MKFFSFYKMKIQKIIKCKHCGTTQRRLVTSGMTDEDLLWHRCEYCNQFGLFIQESNKISLKEFFLDYFRYFRFKYFSCF